MFVPGWPPARAGSMWHPAAAREAARRACPPAVRLGAAALAATLFVAAWWRANPSLLAAAAVLCLLADVPRPTQASGGDFTWLWFESVAPLVNGAACAVARHPSLSTPQRRRPADVLTDPEWPPEWPFSAADFARRDAREDGDFYRSATFQTHVDDAAIEALRQHYASLPQFAAASSAPILDLASSWISHYPPLVGGSARVSGLGMHGEEMRRNPQLGSFKVQDLNRDGRLPYGTPPPPPSPSTHTHTQPHPFSPVLREARSSGGPLLADRRCACPQPTAASSW